MNFMLLMARAISHSFAALTREILFLPLEHKIHIFSPPCNILYLFTSCLCQKPERARYERVRAFDTNNSWIKPRTKHFLCRELFITQNKRIFIELPFWTQIRNKNSLTIEPNANLISFNKKVRFAWFARDARVIGMETPIRYRWLVILPHVK